ncbi:signal recognition particle-docking protein FtsY [Pseudoclavibacter sp. CFCC 13796]|uniref:signal recognition particle-docking protein FtsY n=1 Tax=Pseudoclavibacter sp. CFCC 13796 TaxID=2615179 RepID=UPI001300F303|nr:signal recognition particle-docking protein FtsY [Pseudoclavibacter sp. CFCC 13796]KAB1661293.1 signal recognition particle-docking protein FtsY [Pseudoclavibacter sp. CFCC 13796]
MSKWSLRGSLRNLFQGTRPIDESSWEDLEDSLILGDFGAEASESIVEAVRSNVERLAIADERELRNVLRDELAERLSANDPTLRLTRPQDAATGRLLPAVVLVVGVNGVGKTTTIGKLARFITRANKRVVIGAADTFRAAAVEQVATWGQRAGAEVVRPQQQGQDPASVAYQAVQHGIDVDADVVIIDTAGRLQTKAGLMDELSKIRRVVEKLAPIAEVLLVLDATTGQNGLSQAQAFIDHAGVTGIVLSKIDGSAKGGFVVGVQQTTGISVKLIGFGEGIDDIAAFNANTFAAELVG